MNSQGTFRGVSLFTVAFFDPRTFFAVVVESDLSTSHVASGCLQRASAAMFNFHIQQWMLKLNCFNTRAICVSTAPSP